VIYVYSADYHFKAKVCACDETYAIIISPGWRRGVTGVYSY